MLGHTHKYVTHAPEEVVLMVRGVDEDRLVGDVVRGGRDDQLGGRGVLGVVAVPPPRCHDQEECVSKKGRVRFAVVRLVLPASVMLLVLLLLLLLLLLLSGTVATEPTTVGSRSARRK